MPVLLFFTACWTRPFEARWLATGVTLVLPRKIFWNASCVPEAAVRTNTLIVPFAVAPGMGNCDYNLQTTGRELIETGNRETVVLAHVETRTGIANLDAILGNPHVDVLFLGMYDLSNSYGHPGEFRHPDVAAAVETAIAAAKKHGKVMGMYVPDAKAAEPWAAKGCRFFETASEIDLIDAGARGLVQQFRRLPAS